MLIHARNTVLTMLLLALISIVVVKGVEAVHDSFETKDRMPAEIGRAHV